MLKGKILTSLQWNTGIQLFGKGIAFLLSIVSISVLTRYLGVSGYGNFTLIFTYLSFFELFADFGMQLAIVRQFANQKQTQALWQGTFFWLKVMGIVCAVSVALAVSLVFPYSSEVKMGLLVGAGAVALSWLSGFSNALFQSRMRLDIVSIVDTITRFASLCLILFFVSIHASFLWIVASVLFGNLLGLFLSFLLLSRFVSFSFQFDTQVAKTLLWQSIPLGMSSLLALLYFRVDTLFLSVMRSTSEVGLYSVAYKVLDTLLMLWALYTAALYPYFAQQPSSTQRIKVLKRSLLLSCGITVPVGVVCFFASPAIISLLAGSHFEASTTAFRILLMSLPFLCINNVCYTYFLSQKKERGVLLSMLLVLGMNVIANFLFIPQGGYIAASIITVVSAGILSLCYGMMLFSSDEKH